MSDIEIVHEDDEKTVDRSADPIAELQETVEKLKGELNMVKCERDEACRECHRITRMYDAETHKNADFAKTVMILSRMLTEMQDNIRQY